MKNLAWWICGISVATAGFLVLGVKRAPRIEALAHDLEAAWGDHHTIA